MISKKITKMFDGHITCRSEYGAGSNFIFIVALGKENQLEGTDTTFCRMLNPIQKTYNKITIVQPSADFDGKICTPRQIESKPINVFEEMQKI